MFNIQRDTGSGSPTSIILPNMQCSTTGTTTSIPANTLNVNDKLDFLMVSAGGAKRLTVSIKATLN
jgi:hypothetical protein